METTSCELSIKYEKREARLRQERGKNKPGTRGQDFGVLQPLWWLCNWWCPTVFRSQNSHREAAYLPDKLIQLTEHPGWGTCRSFQGAERRKSQPTSSSSCQMTSRRRGIPLIETLVERKRPGNTLLHCSTVDAWAFNNVATVGKRLKFIAYFLSVFAATR